MNENVMNDQYGMEDLLEQEKYLIHNYGTFIPEASEMPLRTVLTDNLNGCVKDQYQVFAKMEQMGWFKGQEADVNVLTGAKQRFSRHAERAELTYPAECFDKNGAFRFLFVIPTGKIEIPCNIPAVHV